MNAFIAIVKLTCRAALRSLFLRGLVIFLFAILLLLPFLLHSDGTAIGWISITLEYSFALTVFVLSVSAVWQGASVVADDIVDSRLHLIVSKPVSRIKVFLAKYCGVLLVHTVLLLLAAAMIYVLTIYRISTLDMEEGEREKLDKEVLVGRRIYAPDSITEEIEKKTEDEINRLQKEAKARGEEMPREWVTVRDKNKEFSMDEVRKRYQERFRTEMTTAKKDRGTMRWTFSNLPDDIDSKVRIRFRIYSSDGTTMQHKTHGMFGWNYYAPSKSGEGFVTKEAFFLPVKKINTGVVQETEIPNQVKELGKNIIMVKDGKGTLLYENWDRLRDHEFMPEYGPFLLVPITGFFENFCRGVLLMFIAIISFAAFGCSFSAMFSLPTGIFLTFVYVVISVSTRFLLDISNKALLAPDTLLEKIGYYTSKLFDNMLIDPSVYSPGSQLASGELVEFGDIMSVLLFSLIRILPFVLIGLYVYCKRELALAVKD